MITTNTWGRGGLCLLLATTTSVLILDGGKAFSKDAYLPDRAQPMVQFSANLTGNQVQPPNQTRMAANVLITIAADGSPAAGVKMELNSFSSPITAIRILKGEPGSLGALVKAFAIPGTASMATGENPVTLGSMAVGGAHTTITGQNSSAEFLRIVNSPILLTTAEVTWSRGDKVQPLIPADMNDLSEGRLFIEVDTGNYPNGEIRGQITGAENLITRSRYLDYHYGQ